MKNEENTVNNAKVRHVEVTELADFQRLDNYLIKIWKGVPKSHIYRLIRGGNVRINGSRCKPSQKLNTGDIIRLPPVRTSNRDQIADASHPQVLRECTLYEDNSILVIDKPSGIAVHGGSKISGNVIDALRYFRNPDQFLELVHRLDKDTSGCLILAKNLPTLRKLHKAFARQLTSSVSKTYLTLLAGSWTNGPREVQLKLAKNISVSGDKKTTIDETGQHAVSNFTPVRHYDGCVFVKVDLKTGRMHQIRSHAAAIGHPVLGDRKYGSLIANKKFRKMGLNRLFLHSAEVKFFHPETQKYITIKSDLPGDLKLFMEKL
ncbi:MAG: 23S rRNA pseudouridine(955/2504/2580) synthase [Acidiferrobacteraceae bacterium]|nr:23S rRNA pseudouridine(955/2504/2580) synthase [Acidiferrobacteraceae bacterium]|tara:strand:- start:5302 stop:6258 length:957 start_codon:yes stop_codon:yes gene_type:complete